MIFVNVVDVKRNFTHFSRSVNEMFSQKKKKNEYKTLFE